MPVMGHLGLTPQSLHQLGGFKVQARDAEGAERLLEDARSLESLGCFGLVLEAVPQAVAGRVTEALAIPRGGEAISVTVSIGVALFRPGADDLGTLSRRADHALYEAKRQGRNRVRDENGTSTVAAHSEGVIEREAS